MVGEEQETLQRMQRLALDFRKKLAKYRIGFFRAQESCQNMTSLIRHEFIRVIEPDQHGRSLTLEKVRDFSSNFTKPVVFKSMVPLDDQVATRSFLEVATDEKLVWRERTSDAAVSFRGKGGKTDYNYVSGKEGMAAQFLDDIFVHKKDVYAHLGNISSGFKVLHKFPWGRTLFEHVKHEVFRSGWYQIPEWELTGHIFLGNNTADYEEPFCGAPGSDWHMFPTVNVFVLVSGKKKWMTYPPRTGDQLRDPEELIFPSGGREHPQQDREFDTVFLTAGDVLFNVPYEWHKVLNARGWSLGAAFRVIDRAYVDSLLAAPANLANIKARKMGDEYAHMVTSLCIASADPARMHMALNTIEMFILAASRIPFLE